MKALTELYQPSLCSSKSLVLKTFHPDNALPVIGFDNLNRPIFNPNKIDCPFDDAMEVQEAIYYYQISDVLGDGMSHLMIDFERKSTDSRIIAKIIQALIQNHANIKIMPRACDIKEVQQDPYRFREILTGIASANNLLQRNNHLRIRDLIIPQVNHDKALRAARITIEAYRKSFADSRQDLSDIKLVPLVESAHAMLDIRKNVLHNMEAIRGDSQENYTRVMLAMSDTSMGSGVIACLHSLRFALAEIYRNSIELEHSLFPILGGGTLPFRGLQTPEHIEQILTHLPAFQITAQSAITFDYGEIGIQKLAEGIKKTQQNYIHNIQKILQEIPEKSYDIYQQIRHQAEHAYWQDLLSLSRQQLSLPVILSQHGIHAPSRRNRVGSSDGTAGRNTKILNQTINFQRAIGHVFGNLSIGLGSGVLQGCQFLNDLKKQYPKQFSQLHPILLLLFQQDAQLASIKVATQAEKLIGFPGLSDLLRKRLQIAHNILGINLETDLAHEQHLINGMEAWQTGNIKNARRHLQYAAIHRKAIG